MKTYLHAKLVDVEDPDFQSLIDELHHCVGWTRKDQPLSSAFTLLQSIGIEDPRALTAQHLPTPGVLTMKVGTLPPGVVRDFCAELVGLARTHVETFDGKTVLSLIKACFPWPRPIRPRQPSRNEARHQRTTNVILQRRRNGDL